MQQESGGHRPRSLAATIALVTGRSAVALVSVAVLGVTGYGWAFVHQATQHIATTNVIDTQAAGPSVRPLDGALDILLVGMDSRTDVHGKPLPPEVLSAIDAGSNEGELDTDTMILVHVPVDGTRAVAISFPRDSYVKIAGGFGKHKLNSAFLYGRNHALHTPGTTTEEADAAGRKTLISTIEGLTGNAITIDRYAEVNLASFYEISKAVGGVEVCLNAPANDNVSHTHLPAGPQLLSGTDALHFVRQRHGLPRGDLDRIVRQQAFIGGLADKILSGGMLASPAKLGSLISAVQDNVILSSGWDLTEFAEQMQGLTGGGIRFETIPTDGDARTGDGDVILVDPQKVHDFVTGQLASVSTSTPSTPTSSGSAAESSTPTSSEAATPARTETPARLRGLGSAGLGSAGLGSAGLGSASSTTAPSSITADGVTCVN